MSRTSPSKVLQRKIVKLLPRGIKKQLPHIIVVVAISSAKARVLNRVYRGKSRPTNVLSFSYSKEYAEILICPEVIRKEAKVQGNTYQYQMTWMILHGMLHLTGRHHEASLHLTREVEFLENKILGGLFGSKNLKLKVQSSKLQRKTRKL